MVCVFFSLHIVTLHISVGGSTYVSVGAGRGMHQRKEGEEERKKRKGSKREKSEWLIIDCQVCVFIFSRVVRGESNIVLAHHYFPFLFLWLRVACLQHPRHA